VVPRGYEIGLDARANTVGTDPNPPICFRKSRPLFTPEFLAGSASAESKREMDTLERSAPQPFSFGRHRFASIAQSAFRTMLSRFRKPSTGGAAGHYGCADVNYLKTTRRRHFPGFCILRYPQNQLGHTHANMVSKNRFRHQAKNQGSPVAKLRDSRWASPRLLLFNAFLTKAHDVFGPVFVTPATAFIFPLPDRRLSSAPRPT